MQRTITPVILFAALLAPATAAQQPLDENLLANADFESGDLTDWDGTSTGKIVGIYGLDTNAPPLAVSTAMSGDTYVLLGYGNLQQTFDVTGNAAAIDAGNLAVMLSGHFGGWFDDADNAHLSAIFLDDLGATIDSASTTPVTRAERNRETVLMRRAAEFAIPAGTRSIVAEVSLNWSGAPYRAYADNLDFRISTPSVAAPLQLDTELLSNGDFKSGWASASPLELDKVNGWLGGNESSVLVQAYGVGDTPGLDVSTALGGDISCVGDYWGGNAILTQTFDLTGNAANVDAGNLHLAIDGAFGGLTNDPDGASLQARFKNALGLDIGLETLGPITPQMRNKEDVLMRLVDQIPVPPTTRTVVIELQMVFVSGATAEGFADNLSAKLVPASPVAPYPLDTELLSNAGFESGWTPASPLQLANPTGWRGSNMSAIEISEYGQPGNLPLAAGAAINGGLFMVDGYEANAALLQEFDLTGNAADIDAGLLWINLDGYFGASLNDGDRAELRAEFRNSTGAQLSDVTVGAVTPAQRNQEFVALRRSGSFSVPAGTRSLSVVLQMTYGGGGTADGVADNLSAILSLASPADPLPLGSNLISNGDFESGWIASSPLEPMVMMSWTGTYSSSLTVEPYGGATTPPMTVATEIGGGSGLLAAWAANATVYNTLDLTGNAADVDLGKLGIHISGYLGGYSSDPDSAQLNIRFKTASGAPVGSGTIDPVTAADRGNQTTVLYREANFPVPQLTRSVEIEVQMNYFSGGTDDGLADNIAAVLFDTLAGPDMYPGTDEDFHQFTETGTHAMSTGPAFEVKQSAAGEILSVRLDSVGGTFDGGVIFLLAQLFVTGNPPSGGLFPGLAFDPAPVYFLVNGLVGSPIFGPTLLFTDGNTFEFQIPGGLVGNSLLLQAAVVHPLALNGQYATSDGHEIQFVAP